MGMENGINSERPCRFDTKPGTLSYFFLPVLSQSFTSIRWDINVIFANDTTTRAYTDSLGLVNHTCRHGKTV